MDAHPSGKCGAIEFWRFIFSMVIVFAHAIYLGDGNHYLFVSGAIGVEFFFVVSGFLMASSVARLPALEPGKLGRDTVAFMQKKVKHLCPNYYVAWIIAFFFYLISHHMHGIKAIISLFGKCIYELLFITMSGLIYLRVNGAVWYLSSMLLAMALIYPFLRKYYDLFTHLAAPLISLLLLGILMKNFGHLRTGTKWIGYTYKGNLRAIAELCLGISCYPISKKLEAQDLTKLSASLLSLIEHFGYFACLYCGNMSKAIWPPGTLLPQPPASPGICRPQ